VGQSAPDAIHRAHARVPASQNAFAWAESHLLLIVFTIGFSSAIEVAQIQGKLIISRR